MSAPEPRGVTLPPAPTLVPNGWAAINTHAVRRRIEDRERSLSPYATRSQAGVGRQHQEEASPVRGEFQRDRDRILHSKAFRRLKHKTQVFIAPLGDHYVTRLTHTLEVSQIARTIARALNLNEDLTEAMALGHDLGHTPFGHIGEELLGRLAPGGFRHSEQSLRVVDHLEKEGRGLNLTWPVRQGIVSHSKPRGDFLGGDSADDLTLEGQVCRIADAVAYLNHDLADAFRAGILEEEGLPSDVVHALGRRHSERIDTMVCDIIESSWGCTGEAGSDSGKPQAITMSARTRGAVNILREFMFQQVYVPEGRSAEAESAAEVLRVLYNHFTEDIERVPAEYKRPEEPALRAVVDYIAGMTDRYAIRMAESIRPGAAEVFQSRLL